VINRGSAQVLRTRLRGLLQEGAGANDSTRGNRVLFLGMQKTRIMEAVLLLGIVKQHDCATGRVEHRQHQPQFWLVFWVFLGVIACFFLVPVASPQVPATEYV